MGNYLPIHQDIQSRKLKFHYKIFLLKVIVAVIMNSNMIELDENLIWEWLRNEKNVNKYDGKYYFMMMIMFVINKYNSMD